jgi:4-amino-4-deoxy-L-arabinose transferase-like glycosyltransferase
MSDNRKRLADVAFLLSLMFYVMAGVSLVPMHGDEFMLMSMSHDVLYMAQGNWDRIAYKPPIDANSEQYLRMINGTINKDLIGLTWMLSGRDFASLPGIYIWEMPFDWNVRNGNVPPAEALQLARLQSALLTALGVIPIFLLGWQLRLRSLAYPAALIYALHPVILLNGRRAMMESSLILATLLLMSWLLALIVAEHSATASGFMRRLPFWARYTVLGLLAGLAVASKFTGIVVVVAALAAALLAGLTRDRSWRPLAWTGLALIVATLIWFVLSPGYWNNPLGGLQDSIKTRAELLEQQSKTPLLYTTFADRLGALITQPFLTPPQYFEGPNWADVVKDQIAVHEQSSLDGWGWGWLSLIFGGLLTLLAGIGLLNLIKDALRRDLIAWAVLIWTLAVFVYGLTIPFAWQRYYLPWTLVMIVLASMGLGRLFVRRLPEENRQQITSDTPAA